jgi:biopolymer transport protein ExbD
VNFRGARSRRIEPQLDLTPMIDAVFLLLLFFLITASFSQERQVVVRVELPSGSAGDSSAPQAQASVWVGDDGSLSWQLGNGEAARDLTVADIRTRLEALKGTAPETTIYLFGDREVTYGRVVEVLDLCRALDLRVYNVVQEAN